MNYDDLYIQGEPGTRSEASVLVKYEVKPEIWASEAAECERVFKEEWDKCMAKDNAYAISNLELC